MALFRPYARDEKRESTTKASDLVGAPAHKGAHAARRTGQPAVVEDRREPSDAELTGAAAARGPVKKDRPTPSRRQAEAARMERIHPSLSRKEQRALERQTGRERRAAAMDAAESTPQRRLLRNYIDNSWHVGEFLMPAMIVLLALTFGAQYYPPMITWISIAMWALLVAVIVDVALTWRGFKKVLRQRHPGASTRGLMMYAMNRMIQIRRFRTPPPVIKRGQGY